MILWCDKCAKVLDTAAVGNGYDGTVRGENAIEDADPVSGNLSVCIAGPSVAAAAAAAVLACDSRMHVEVAA
jgi:hypothetical protein